MIVCFVIVTVFCCLLSIMTGVWKSHVHLTASRAAAVCDRVVRFVFKASDTCYGINKTYWNSWFGFLLQMITSTDIHMTLQPVLHPLWLSIVFKHMFLTKHIPTPLTITCSLILLFVWLQCVCLPRALQLQEAAAHHLCISVVFIINDKGGACCAPLLWCMPCMLLIHTQVARGNFFGGAYNKV